MIKKTTKQTTVQEEQNPEEINKSILNFELGKIKAKANNFWIAIGFLIAFTICFITFCICNTVTKITDQYFKQLSELSLQINEKHEISHQKKL